MKLSIIIPVYNEAKTLLRILSKVKAVDINKEIVIVNDGSTDDTYNILKNVKDGNIKIVHHEINQGKGAAIKTALQYVSGDIIIIQDGDLEYNPKDYIRLIEPIMSGRTNVVYGSRILGKAAKSYFIYYLGGRLLTFLVNLLYGAKLTDISTGYKIFKTKVLKSLKLKYAGFEFCAEVTAKLLNKGYKIHEEPISYFPRTFKEGKKINWKVGFKVASVLLKYKIGCDNSSS